MEGLLAREQAGNSSTARIERTLFFFLSRWYCGWKSCTVRSSPSQALLDSKPSSCQDATAWQAFSPTGNGTCVDPTAPVEGAPPFTSESDRSCVRTPGARERYGCHFPYSWLERCGTKKVDRSLAKSVSARPSTPSPPWPSSPFQTWQAPAPLPLQDGAEQRPLRTSWCAPLQS